MGSSRHKEYNKQPVNVRHVHRLQAVSSYFCFIKVFKDYPSGHQEPYSAHLGLCPLERQLHNRGFHRIPLFQDPGTKIAKDSDKLPQAGPEHVKSLQHPYNKGPGYMKSYEW